MLVILILLIFTQNTIYIFAEEKISIDNIRTHNEVNDINSNKLNKENIEKKCEYPSDNP